MKNRIVKTLLLASLMAWALGCGPPKWEYQEGTLFPRQWKTQYLKIRACEKSEDHSGPYNEVYINRSAHALWKVGKSPLPVGTVLLKPQYRDAGCTSFAVWTAMRKEKKGSYPASSDWYWQTVFPNGKIVVAGKSKFCTSCHENCEDMVCTEP